MDVIPSFFLTSIRGNLMLALIVLVFIGMIYKILSEAYHISQISSVNIGMSSDMSRTARHGVVWVRDGEMLVQRGFISDNPELLKQPSGWLIRELFKQVMSMGYEPVHLEIMVGDRTQMYKFGQKRPVINFTRPAW